MDSLLGMLRLGWRLNPMLAYEEHGTGTRHVVVYHFCLERDLERVTMRVVNNPVALRVIRENRFQIVRHQMNT